MVNSNYALAYSEVLEILRYIPQEDYDKIPKEKIEFYNKNANKNYIFNYDPDKTLEEQKVSDITKGIIILLFRDYWATDKQKEKIIAKQVYDRKKLEEEKRAMYNPDDIFKNNISDTENNTSENVAIVEYIEQKWYQKIITKILNIFRKK
mgnify:CR=1 FL=1